mmetsp:Transcript_137653/g.439468  ORF Transcript_137653/g.439468 Transcript_137653/m.439468 type:complete len:273 (+) Transcript_137653:1039-1857(+)
MPLDLRANPLPAFCTTTSRQRQHLHLRHKLKSTCCTRQHLVDVRNSASLIATLRPTVHFLLAHKLRPSFDMSLHLQSNPPATCARTNDEQMVCLQPLRKLREVSSNCRYLDRDFGRSCSKAIPRSCSHPQRVQKHEVLHSERAHLSAHQHRQASSTTARRAMRRHAEHMRGARRSQDRPTPKGRFWPRCRRGVFRPQQGLASDPSTAEWRVASPSTRPRFPSPCRLCGERATPRGLVCQSLVRRRPTAPATASPRAVHASCAARFGARVSGW